MSKHRTNGRISMRIPMEPAYVEHPIKTTLIKLGVFFATLLFGGAFVFGMVAILMALARWFS